MTGPSSTLEGAGKSLASQRSQALRLEWSQFDFLRFIAGIRTLIALLAGIGMLSRGIGDSPLAWVALSYLLLATALLVRTLRQGPQAGEARWLWVDAATIAIVCRLAEQDAPSLGVISVVPVVAMSVLAGARQGLAMALASATAMLLPNPWDAAADERTFVTLPAASMMLLLALGPATPWLTLPNRALRERLRLLDEFNGRSDPRRGLLHNVDVLLGLLSAHFRAGVVVLSLQGPEPRIFRRDIDGATRLLDEASAAIWRVRRAALPDNAGCLCTGAGSERVRAVHLEPFAERRVQIDDHARKALLDIGAETIALPLMSYGKPLGHLCLTRHDEPFAVTDLRWLHDAMREVLPLLERSDLLEQLQRETVASEREKIGRDLHDSAVQPYLGLKYGLEALARKAGHDNPIAQHIRQLVDLTNQELHNLRDLVSGLRKGDDPATVTALMAALQRQAARFEALYGLKVHLLAPDAFQLRGGAAKAVLHMINEALTNVRRHTEATVVTVLLDVHDDRVTVRVRNDHGAVDRWSPWRQFVPLSLTQRAQEFGGVVTVVNDPQCTEVVIALPIAGTLA